MSPARAARTRPGRKAAMGRRGRSCLFRCAGQGDRPRLRRRADENRAGGCRQPEKDYRKVMGAGPEISIVLPAHNEAGNITPIAAAIARAVALEGAYEIVFVDDGSTDGTLAAIRGAARDPAIRYLSFTRNFGHQAALRAGLRHAKGRGVIV